MKDCDHHGHRVYARRSFANGSVQYCIQCTRCLEVVKTPEHGYRPYIRHDEIPTGNKIFDFIEPEDAL
jgi:hypothetical protein